MKVTSIFKRAGETCSECGEPKDHLHIQVSPEMQDLMRHMHEDGQRRGEMHQHGQQRVVDLSDPVDLKSHMVEAHGYDPEHDFWRNSHDLVDHPAFQDTGPEDDDRPLEHHEVRSLHDWEHAHGVKNEHPDYSGGMPGHFLNDMHFHTAVRKTATWIGDHPDEPTLFWRAPQSKKWEVHVSNWTPDRQLREGYGAEAHQQVHLFHADEISPPHPNAPAGSVPRGGWSVERNSNTGEMRYTPNTWGRVVPHVPPHVQAQVDKAQDEVDKHAADHANLYGGLADHQDIQDDQARAERDHDSRDKGNQMFRNLLNSANESTCPKCDGNGNTEHGPGTCIACDGTGFLKHSVNYSKRPKGDLLHRPDGTLRTTCPTTSGRDLELFERQRARHDPDTCRRCKKQSEGSLTKTADEDQCPRCSEDSNPTIGKDRYRCQNCGWEHGPAFDLDLHMALSDFETELRKSAPHLRPGSVMDAMGDAVKKIPNRYLGVLSQHFASEEPEKTAGDYLHAISNEGADYWAKPKGEAPYSPFEAHHGLASKEEGHGPWTIVRHPETRAYHLVDNQGRSANTFGPSTGLAPYEWHDQHAHQSALHGWVQANQDHGHIPKWRTPETRTHPGQVAEPNSEVEETGLSARTHMGRGLRLPGSSNARLPGESLEDAFGIDTQHIQFHMPPPPIEHTTEDPKVAEFKKRAEDHPAPKVYPTKIVTQTSSREHGTTYRQVRHGEPEYDTKSAFHDPSPSEEFHGPYRVIQHPETGKYHVVDNQDRVTGYGGSEGIDEQHHAERMRDYADGRQASKEHGKALAESIFNGTMEALDPGGTPESRRSERHLSRMSDLLGRYEGGDHHPLHPGKFDYDDEDEKGDKNGQPYYEVSHPSGFTARDYGGPNVHVYHKATGESAYDTVDASDPARQTEQSPPKPPGFGHDELHQVLHHWVHGAPHDPRYPDDTDPDTARGWAAGKYHAGEEPRIQRWQQRNGYRG